MPAERTYHPVTRGQIDDDFPADLVTNSEIVPPMPRSPPQQGSKPSSGCHAHIQAGAVAARNGDGASAGPTPRIKNPAAPSSFD